MPPYIPFLTLTTLLSQQHVTTPLEKHPNLLQSSPTTTNNNTTTIPLVSFDGTPSTTHEWSTLNDPVMGGKSTSTFSISNQKGIFDGEVVDVPFLHAPGFVQAFTTFRNRNRFFHRIDNEKSGNKFPDVRGCEALQIVAGLPGGEEYEGFKISFGTKKSKKYHCGRHSYGYKAALPLLGGVEGVQTAVVPFGEFSDCNNDATGLPIVTCAEDEDVCPDDDTLADLKTIAIWGEGVNGKFHMEITSIEAIGCTSSPSTEPLEMASAAANGSSSGGEIILATFDGNKETTRKWKEMNDPVMGGESTGTFTIDDKSGVGHFVGEVVDVPFLQAPGFIQVKTTDTLRPFPDVSHCEGMKLLVRSHTNYDGYRFSFGMAHPPEGKRFAYGYKADFQPMSSSSDDGSFESILLPFKSFTDYWDDATGDAIKTCQENERYCPGEMVLKNVKTLAFWGEGKDGKVDLEIKSVSAYGCGEAVDVGKVDEKKKRYLRN